MKKFNLTLIVFLGITMPLIAQFYDLQNNSFYYMDTTACPSNSSVEILAYKNWEIYQTTNNRWDGPIDTTYCLETDTLKQIKVQNIHTPGFLFIRFKIDSSVDQNMFKNSLYTLSATCSSTDANLLDTNTCDGTDSCNANLIYIGIPDSAGTEDTTRFYGIKPSYSFSATYGTKIQFEGCIPTEKFDSNTIEEFIVQLKLNPPADSNATLTLEYFGFSHMYEIFTFNDLNSIAHQSGNSFTFWEEASFLALHDSGYPTPNNISYIDVNPNPNPDSVTNYEIYINEFQHLAFQPFTDLRGGLTNSSSTDRHTLTIVNDGGDICMDYFIEVRLGGGSTFEYRKGQVHLNHYTACLLFQEGATLRIAENATFSYGASGNGMLGIQAGMKLDMKDNSEFRIGNTLVMLDNTWQSEHLPNEIHWRLNEGNKVIFLPGSHIMNKSKVHPDMKINVFLNGGTMDLSGLPEAERKYIHFIYENPPSEQNQSLYDVNVSNLLLSNLNVSFQSNKAQTIHYQLTDNLGRVMLDREKWVNFGSGGLFDNINGLHAGMYYLSVQTEDGQKLGYKLIKR